MATLLIREPTQRRHLFHTRDAQITIGRSDENELALSHTSVSRIHAGLYGDRGHWTIEDLKSRNGTYVNGRRIQRQELRSTDTVRIGDYEIVYFGEQDTSVHGFRGIGSWHGRATANVKGRIADDEDTRTNVASAAVEQAPTWSTKDRIGAIIRPKAKHGNAWRPGKTRLVFGGPKGIGVLRMMDLSPAAEVAWNKRAHILRRLSWYANISCNGTRVVETVELQPEDEFQIGRSTFCYDVIGPIGPDVIGHV